MAPELDELDPELDAELAEEVELAPDDPACDPELDPALVPELAADDPELPEFCLAVDPDEVPEPVPESEPELPVGPPALDSSLDDGPPWLPHAPTSTATPTNRNQRLIMSGAYPSVRVMGRDPRKLHDAMGRQAPKLQVPGRNVRVQPKWHFPP